MIDELALPKASLAMDFASSPSELGAREDIYMRKIRKKILTDNAERPIAVQIDYSDWLEIERSLNLQGEDPPNTDLSSYEGIITLTEEPLEYQSRIRQEWS
jgi:hypothetical protein